VKLAEVLFPTDFSQASDVAARVAREVALESGARLHFVHVVPPVTDPGDSAVRLGGLAQALGEGLRVQTALLAGRVARNIVDYARDKAVDLIVLGTHGRSGVSHAILGSVAEAVVRLAPCLVLTVPPGAAAPRPETAAVAAAAGGRCVVCSGPTDDLVCETCRARIRGEALERKVEAERAGHRGLPA
jgi:nucleotide-binding universal stress UspA family protein